VEIDDHIAALRTDGELMASAAAAVAPDVAIPTCPEWCMRDLVLHQGQVHRWAAANVTDATGQMADPQAAMGPAPSDDALVDWFRDGHHALVAALDGADPGGAYWTFMPAPSPLAFWARRQCHETGMHRVDAEAASGPVTPFPAAVAADGIDELLCSFITRPGGRLQSDPPRRLRVVATDTNDAWLVRIANDVVTERGTGEERAPDADCTLAGPASDLHLFLWNRGGTDTLTAEGDRSMLDLWSGSVTIRWR
jgi:uncharacterized protein (TIGR03083 family)